MSRSLHGIAGPSSIRVRVTYNIITADIHITNSYIALYHVKELANLSSYPTHQENCHIENLSIQQKKLI